MIKTQILWRATKTAKKTPENIKEHSTFHSELALHDPNFTETDKIWGGNVRWITPGRKPRFYQLIGRKKTTTTSEKKNEKVMVIWISLDNNWQSFGTVPVNLFVSQESRPLRITVFFLSLEIKNFLCIM